MAPDRVDESPSVVWAVLQLVEDLVPAGDLDAMLAALPLEDRARIRRFRRAADRRQRVAATLLLRRVLARATGRPEPRLNIRRTPSGRPRLDDLAYNGDFNLSHHGPWVAVAWTNVGRVGIDLATVGEASVHVAPYAFSSEETAYLRTLGCEHQPTMLATLWALKEAYVKALGIGVARRMATITFSPALLAQERFITDFSGESWTFARVYPDPGTVLAVASDCAHEVRFVTWAKKSDSDSEPRSWRDFES